MGGGQSAPNAGRRSNGPAPILNDVYNANPGSQNNQNVQRQSNPQQNRGSPSRSRGQGNSSRSSGGRVVVMNNDLLLLQNTVKLVKNSKNPNLYSVTFTLDTMFEAIVSTFFFVHDQRDPLLEITYELAPDPKYNIPPKHFKYPAGRYIKISENSYCLELGRYTDEELSHHTTELYPLIIRVEKIDPKQKEKKVFFHYYHFVREEGELVIKPVRSKLELNGQAFEVNEIYGINSTEFGKEQGATMEDSEKECIICFSDQRDTIIVPCRHMCICVNCAKSLQAQPNSKCPICRKDIESFLRLTKNMPNVGTLQNPPVGMQPSPSMNPGAHPEQSDPFHLGGH
jgi:hypothetical protein